MIEFSQWLGAMEIVDDVPCGVYQAQYSDALLEGQREALLDNCLAAAVLDFAESAQDGRWSGTPAQFLQLLDQAATPGTKRSREWPLNVIALSKRLMPLQAGLLTQGVTVELTREKHRTITVTRIAGADHA